MCMVELAQLVRAPDCGSGGHGFDSRILPHKKTTIVCVFSDSCFL